MFPLPLGTVYKLKKRYYLNFLGYLIGIEDRIYLDLKQTKKEDKFSYENLTKKTIYAKKNCNTPF